MTDPLTTDTEWLTLTEAAGRLGIHATTLRRWADKGNIPFMLTPGGHRRFAAAEVEQFVQRRHNRRTGDKRLEKIWAQKALAQTRAEMVDHQQDRWLVAAGEADREQKRLLGRRLMGLLMQYISADDVDGRDGEILSEAQTIGHLYAEEARESQMSLTDALEATMFFRDNLVEAAIQLPKSARVRPAANRRLLRRINAFLNTVQLAIAEVYEQAKVAEGSTA